MVKSEYWVDNPLEGVEPISDLQESSRMCDVTLLSKSLNNKIKVIIHRSLNLDCDHVQ